MATNFNDSPRPAWNILSHGKLQLSGDPWDKSNYKQRPSLSIHVFSNNPRLRVYMNDGRTAKPLSYKTTSYTLEAIFEAIIHFSNKKEPGFHTVTIEDWRDMQGRQLDKKTIVGYITIGRDNEGVMFIATQAGKNDPIAKFPFMMDFYSDMLGMDGEKLDPRLASSYHARGWVTLNRKLISDYISLHGKEVVKKPPPNSNSGGNNNQYNVQAAPPVQAAPTGDENFDGDTW